MIKEMILEVKADNIVVPGSAKERIDTLYLPVAPRHVVNFFNFMQNHIKLDATDVSMGGTVSVRFRESRYNLSELMKEEGYDYIIHQNFINEFENKLLEQHYNALDKK
jgi:hypothetical protein